MTNQAHTPEWELTGTCIHFKTDQDARDFIHAAICHDELLEALKRFKEDTRKLGMLEPEYVNEAIKKAEAS